LRGIEKNMNDGESRDGKNGEKGEKRRDGVARPVPNTVSQFIEIVIVSKTLSFLL
jgi:hypothetical protein